jgi:hypothetical protein
MLAGTSQVASAYVPCPRGEIREANVESWNTLWGSSAETAKGVTLCEGVGGLFNNTRGYLQIADLGDGAKIRLQTQLHPLSPEPSYYEPNTLYSRRSAEEWYNWIRGLRSTEENAAYLEPRASRLFSTTNATFFTETGTSWTTLPFPFINWANTTTLGLSFQRAFPSFPEEWEIESPERDEDYEAPKKALLIDSRFFSSPQQARIESFRTRYEIEDMAAWIEREEFFPADAAVGFTPEFRVGESNLRTYFGVYGDEVYVWVTDDEFTNAEANATMQEIKPGMDVIQMDGGGSSQFYSAYGEMRSSVPVDGRPVPNVLAIYRAP